MAQGLASHHPACHTEDQARPAASQLRSLRTVPLRSHERELREVEQAPLCHLPLLQVRLQSGCAWQHSLLLCASVAFLAASVCRGALCDWLFRVSPRRVECGGYLGGGGMMAKVWSSLPPSPEPLSTWSIRARPCLLCRAPCTEVWGTGGGLWWPTLLLLCDTSHSRASGR